MNNDSEHLTWGQLMRKSVLEEGLAMDTCRICNGQTVSGSVHEECVAGIEQERDEAREASRLLYHKVVGNVRNIEPFWLKTYPWLEGEEAKSDRDVARAFWRMAWFLAVQIRRDTGQPMEHTEAEIQRLERAHPWLKEE